MQYPLKQKYCLIKRSYMVSSAGKMDVNRFGLCLPDARKQHLKPAHTRCNSLPTYRIIGLLLKMCPPLLGNSYIAPV